MSTSKIIKSIKTNRYSWQVSRENSNGIVFSYKPNPNWVFVVVPTAYVLKTLDGEVYMRWTREDAVAKQLWDCLVDVYINS